MKINTNSNVYTILYASGVVIVVAFLLAFFSSVLKEPSEANERIDKQKQILASLRLAPEKSQVEAEYAKVVTADLIVNEKGDVKAENGGFAINRKDINAEALPIYICKVDTTTKYVIPLVGKGLWGTIWGYIALDDDCETVYGTYFGHESETAGLGALIAEKAFQEEFQGKKIADTAGNQLTVVKHGAKQTNSDIECDGISGATLTTNGVNAMLHDYLALYKNYLSKLKK